MDSQGLTTWVDYELGSDMELLQFCISKKSDYFNTVIQFNGHHLVRLLTNMILMVYSVYF